MISRSSNSRVEAGLPEGFENIDSTVTNMEIAKKFFMGTAKLQGPLEKLLRECKPDCLVADTFFPWAVDSASKFGIHSLVFHSTGFFSLCTTAIITEHKPHEKVSSDSEPFLLPGLPGDIHFTRNQLPEFLKSKDETDFIKILRDSRKAEEKSYGVVFNSFHELEPDYVDYYKNVLGRRRVWCVGPLSLNIGDKTWRGKQGSIDENQCLKWLDLKKPNSVVYICFGSVADFKSDQLMEIAMGLEASGQDFIWVVRKNGREEKEDCWLPQQFEKRMEGKGLIIRGWAPQVLILEHEAVGGFVSHCGWNSTLEGITAGVGMVTWPIGAEQFSNEKLLTQVLKIGVSVGASKWVRLVGDFVRREAIEKAVKQVIVGEEESQSTWSYGKESCGERWLLIL